MVVALQGHPCSREGQGYFGGRDKGLQEHCRSLEFSKLPLFPLLVHKTHCNPRLTAAESALVPQHRSMS